MPVTHEQAQQLASLARAIRPHGARRWDEPGVMAAIGAVRHLDLAEVAMVVVGAAADRGLETPAAIGNTKSPVWTGRWRNADKTEDRRPYDPNTFCEWSGRPMVRCAGSDHDCVTAAEYAARLAAAPPKPPLPRVRTTADAETTSAEGRTSEEEADG